MRIEEGLEFNDVLVKPILSMVNSRDDIDISTEFTNFTLDFPLFASPMVGVTDSKFISLLSDLGGLGFLHRFYESIEEWELELEAVKSVKNFGLAVGLNQKFEWLLDYQPKILLIDLANAYTSAVREYCKKVKNYIIKNNMPVMLMCGNVSTRSGAIAMQNSGADIVRYLIGTGSNCSTRNQTAIGVPSVTALMEVKDLDVYICADGGIDSSGSFVKALVAGAQLALSGGLYARTYEAPNKGSLSGMASRTHQKNMGYKIKSVEGFDTHFEKLYSLQQFVEEFSYGIKSAGTYLNARTLQEIADNGTFVRTGNGSIKRL